MNRSLPNIANRFYSSKKDEKSQSILTDDILAKAGFDEPLEKEKQKESKRNSESEQGQEPENEPENEGEGEGKTRRRRKRNTQTKKDLQREKYANWFYISSFGFGVLGLGYMSREWDSEEEQKRLEAKDIPNGFNPKDMYGRMNKRLGSLFTFFSEPAFEQLLPPPPPELYRRPLTLVLTLDDLLIHSEWDTKHGWRTAKRPGLDYFLGYLSQYYEIVIFGSNSSMFSEKAVQKLDPLHLSIQYALFREACRYKDGKLIKDLSLLNRDLGKVLMIDVNEEHCSAQPENSLILKPWDGKADDDLVRLIPFLEYLANQPLKDIRPIMSTFDKSNIIEEFDKREKLLREKWYEENKHKMQGSNLIGKVFSTLMGVESISATGNTGPKMPLDIMREHGQRGYENMQNWVKANSKQLLEEEQKLKEHFGKVSLNQVLEGKAQPSPEDIAKAQEAMKKEQN
ncbi:HAD-like protein [Hyphopichia burtonii NRRL Y-1933]|uniref:Mitochondrial import inner membrane translocase subunit TIM50 n=1 Tax=Hyphopichia burtonii NRRL Y-1933 TaxID=984485 RepID=A0A1E4RPR4_9ASCO|nr:HAD-like protein [Hyphopichia burtonii NRRL Y-1933]ODV69216.1 HAD-like protein [Hyphopichia burtonii NRRL Y-1933]